MIREWEYGGYKIKWLGKFPFSLSQPFVCGKPEACEVAKKKWIEHQIQIGNAINLQPTNAFTSGMINQPTEKM